MPAAACIQVSFHAWVQEGGAGVRGTVQELGVKGGWGAHRGQNTSSPKVSFSLKLALLTGVVLGNLNKTLLIKWT